MSPQDYQAAITLILMIMTGLGTWLTNRATIQKLRADIANNNLSSQIQAAGTLSSESIKWAQEFRLQLDAAQNELIELQKKLNELTAKLAEKEVELRKKDEIILAQGKRIAELEGK